MMQAIDRKAAIAAYKERKIVPGIYVVTCAVTRARWVGRARDLSNVWGRLSFELQQGLCRHAVLQAAWRAHGAAAFALDTVERFDDEKVHVSDKELEAHRRRWCARLGAEAI